MDIDEQKLRELGFSIRSNGDHTFRAYRSERGNLAVIMHRGSYEDAVNKIKEVVGYSKDLKGRAVALGLNGIAA